MDEREKLIRQKLKNDYPHYSSRCLHIRSKTGEIKKFELNRAQKYIHTKVENQRALTGKVRAVILKGRQQGCSTYIEGRFYWRVTHGFGLRAFILTHEDDATQNLFEMAQRYHDNCPILVKPSTKSSNAKELIFGDLDSGYKLGTAGNKAVGRSSTIQFLHASEAAFYKHADEHAKGIMQTVPDMPNTEIFIESTANGVGNWFHQQWQQAEAGLSDFIAIFVPWFWQDEYKKEAPDNFILDEEEANLVEHYGLTNEQISWRRNKINQLSVNGMDGIKAFKQEYPCNAQEAFQMTGEDTFIEPDLVLMARKTNIEEPVGPLLVGVDPARYGDDRTSIIRRKGRKAYGLQSYTKKSTTEVTGIVHNIIINENPDKVFIDIGGLGAGIYDQLIELGHGKVVIGINAGSSPLDKDKYINKRSEMWSEGKKWLQETPCQVPDIDSFHADMCNIKYYWDSKGRLALERKESMKKRGIRSPDEGDAFMLTFAYPVSALLKNDGKDREVAAKIMSISQKVSAIRKSRKW